MAEPDLRTWDAWRTQHQVFELEWWKEALANGHTGEPAEPPFWSDVEAFIKPQGAIIDIGAGRPAFRPARDRSAAYEYSTPGNGGRASRFLRLGECHIVGLQADTIGRNAPDHTIGWRILDNMLAYGRRMRLCGGDRLPSAVPRPSRLPREVRGRDRQGSQSATSASRSGAAAP
jgi:hypothetical protein